MTKYYRNLVFKTIALMPEIINKINKIADCMFL